MHRKHFVVPIIVFFGITSLIFSGKLQIRTGTPTTPVPQTNITGEQLTGFLYISPGGSHEKIIGMLEQAKYTIDIRGYQITDKEIIKVLLNKAKSGIKVRLVLENKIYGDASKDYLNFYKQIQGSTIEVKSDEGLGTNFTHAKTFLIDTTTFIVSTANSTYPGFFANREYRFVSSQKNTAELLGKAFDLDWNRQRNTLTFPSNIWFCPLNCRTEVTKFIDQATTSITIQAQYLEDPQLIEQLAQKAKKGVFVRLIFGKYQEDALPEELKKLTRLQADPNVHAKNILIDEQKLYVGSMNLSKNAIENNREIGIVTEDSRVINTFLKQFTEDRENHAKAY